MTFFSGRFSAPSQRQHHEEVPASLGHLFSVATHSIDPHTRDVSVASEWLPPATVQSTCQPAPAASPSVLNNLQPTFAPHNKRLRMEPPALVKLTNISQTSGPGPGMSLASPHVRPPPQMPGPSPQHLRMIPE